MCSSCSQLLSYYQPSMAPAAKQTLVRSCVLDLRQNTPCVQPVALHCLLLRHLPAGSPCDLPGYTGTAQGGLR